MGIYSLTILGNSSHYCQASNGFVDGRFGLPFGKHKRSAVPCVPELPATAAPILRRGAAGPFTERHEPYSLLRVQSGMDEK